MKNFEKFEFQSEKNKKERQPELNEKEEELKRKKYEKEKREKEKRVIDELINSGLSFVLRGSWAGEIISGIPSKHKDIDIYVEKKIGIKLRSF